ncbi:MAG: cupin [Cellulomonas sp. 73-145]|uniref:(R)-mandelonitrile lyase n=1 Tax=Cellulomonas sp. 73-145 TaxID=1895739 RepID=UPI000928A27E|nr:cupin domain-containing protein [Cellulomonas sp. 73-145]MBN9327335.1 cupin domain-containing protein [Cellulomonas sp.]OJV56715.1 MAG: cupin [Cellulomonas sp. 73-145]
MHILPATPTTKNPPTQFRGDVWLDVIASPQDGDQRMTVGRVRFAPGAGTAWHSHARGQFLHVTQGVGRFGVRGGTVIELHPGQTLYTPPGQEHWHAANEDCFMEHLAMLEAGDDPATSTTWLEHVTEEEYRGGA